MLPKGTITARNQISMGTVGVDMLVHVVSHTYNNLSGQGLIMANGSYGSLFDVSDLTLPREVNGIIKDPAKVREIVSQLPDGEEKARMQGILNGIQEGQPGYHLENASLKKMYDAAVIIRS